MATAGDVSNQKIDIGRVVSRGFETLHRQFLPFLGLSILLAALPILILQYLLYQSIGDVDPNDPTAGFALFSTPLYWLTLLVTMLAGYLVQATLVRSSILELNGRPADLGGSIAVALRLLLPMIGLVILSSILIGIGMVLLIVPGVIIYLMLIVSVPALVEERRGVIASMQRSRELTRGSRLLILGLVVLFVIFYFIMAGIIGLIVRAIAPDELIFMAVISALTSALTGMFMSVMLASLYVDLRTVKEGATTDSLASIFE